MEFKCSVPEEKINDFSDRAKDCIQKETQKYANLLVDEAEREGKNFQIEGASNEVTESAVLQAVQNYRRTRKRRTGLIIFRIISEIGLFISGIMFLPEHFFKPDSTVNIPYFFIFGAVLLASIVSTTAAHFMGGE